MSEHSTEQLPEHLDDEAARPSRAGGPLRFARMTGSSIAGRDAAPWVTDFLNAAYYRRPVWPSARSTTCGWPSAC